MTGQNGLVTHSKVPLQLLVRVQEEEAQAAGRRQGGAVSDGNSEERARDDGEADRTDRRRSRGCSPRPRSAFAVLLASVRGAAEVKYEFSFGSEGTGAGQFREPASISQNTTTGDIYVADRQNNRIQKFDEAGNFLEAWGFDVVASGADDKPLVDEVQRVTIKAVDGTFSLTFGADTTHAARLQRRAPARLKRRSTPCPRSTAAAAR